MEQAVSSAAVEGAEGLQVIRKENAESPRGLHPLGLVALRTYNAG